MADTSYAFSDYMTISGSCTLLGKGAGSTSLSYVNATGTTIIGANAGIGLVNGPDNVIIGNGANVAPNTGQCTIIGNRAVCNATSSASKVILIGDDAQISATHTAVCVLGGQTNGSSIVDYGLGHMYYMPIATYSGSSTVSGADICGGVITFASGAVTCYFPTEKVVFDAMKDPVVGSGIRLLIYKYTSYNLTINAANLSDYHGTTTIASNTAAYFYWVVTDANPSNPRFMVRSSRCNLHT